MANLIISETTESFREKGNNIITENDEWKKIYENIKTECKAIYPDTWSGPACQKYLTIIDTKDEEFVKMYDVLTEYATWMIDTAEDLEKTIADSLGDNGAGSYGGDMRSGHLR